MPGRSLAYLEAASGRTAERSWSVTVREGHPVPRQPLKAGRPVVVATRSCIPWLHLDRRADPALIVAKDDYEVRAVLRHYSLRNHAETHDTEQGNKHPDLIVSD